MCYSIASLMSNSCNGLSDLISTTKLYISVQNYPIINNKAINFLAFYQFILNLIHANYC
jgi:hypothetical protein